MFKNFVLNMAIMLDVLTDRKKSRRRPRASVLALNALLWSTPSLASSDGNNLPAVPPPNQRGRAAATRKRSNRTPLRTLKTLLQEMEASDFSGYSSWGDERNLRDYEEGSEDLREARAGEREGTADSNQSEGRVGASSSDYSLTASTPQSLGNPPAVAAERRRGAGGSRGKAGSGGGRGGGAAAAAAAAVGSAASPGGVDSFVTRTDSRALSVPPDDREDLTLREPEAFSAEVFVTEALHTLYRLAAMAVLACLVALAAVLPATLTSNGEGQAFASAADATLSTVQAGGGGLAAWSAVGKSQAQAAAASGAAGAAVAGAGSWVGLVTRALWSRKFQGNCALLLATAAPSVLFSSIVFDGSKVTVHNFVKVLFRSFTGGFLLSFLAQVFSATVLRVGCYAVLEPGLLTSVAQPKGLPLTALPWLLRDHGYRVGALTAFVSEFLVDCVSSPLIEEAAKLLVLTTSGILPAPGSALARHTSVHTYLCYMLASGTGLKLADNMRRVCLYTSAQCHQKTFFAFARGVFPVHEICAALTAMALAKRDVLSKPTPMQYQQTAPAAASTSASNSPLAGLVDGNRAVLSWLRLLLPAACLHGMGNFRGKKPLFKWASHTPWVEMQLQAWSTADDAPPAKVITNGMLGLFWLSILVNATTRCCRSYYFISRDQRRLLRMDRYTAWQHQGATTQQAAEGRDQMAAIGAANAEGGSGGSEEADYAAGSASEIGY